MKIFFHIGPHKTGTTSIQAYLLDRFGSDEPMPPVWYPKPDQLGPGHAKLAALMNEKDRDPSFNPLQDLVGQARSAGIDTLILSSEDFVKAYHVREVFSAYAEAFSGHELVLVTTQNAVSTRLVSLWQELVKHRHTDSIADSEERIFVNPGVRSGTITTFAQALDPQSIAIVYSGRDEEPHVLVHRMLSAIGLPIEGHPAPSASIRHNVRLNYLEAELLRCLNVLLKAKAPASTRNTHAILRATLLNAFSSEEWRRAAPQIPIEPPESLVEAALSAASEIAAEFQALQERWPVHVFGDPATLTRVSSTSRSDSPEADEPLTLATPSPTRTEPGGGTDDVSALRAQLRERKQQIAKLRNLAQEANQRAEEAERRYQRLRGRPAVRTSLRLANVARPFLRAARRFRKSEPRSGISS